MKKVLKCIWDHYDDTLAFVTFVGLFLVVLFQMVARSVFNFGFVWTEELSRLLLMYACFSSLPVILKTRKELKLTLLTDRLSARNQHIFDILVQVISIVTFAFLAYCGYKTTVFQKTNIMAAMRFSMAYMYVAFPISMLCGITRAAQKIVEDVRLLKGEEV